MLTMYLLVSKSRLYSALVAVIGSQQLTTVTGNNSDDSWLKVLRQLNDNINRHSNPPDLTGSLPVSIAYTAAIPHSPNSWQNQRKLKRKKKSLLAFCSNIVNGKAKTCT